MSLSSAFFLPKRRKPANVLPGFGLALGSSSLYLVLIVLTPLSATVLKAFITTRDALWTAATASRVAAPYGLAFDASLIAVVINLVLGLTVAWVLVHYCFPGKRLIDALVGLPFVLSAAVASIALIALYTPSGWIGSQLEPLGLEVALTSLGTVVAPTFIGLLFVVHTVQPVPEDLETELEEVAASLDTARQQAFIRVILPILLPALLTGFTLAFARAIGGYGPVIFIAGNMPVVPEVTSLMIYSKLEQLDYAGITAIAVIMLGTLFTPLLAINLLQI